MLRNTTFLVLVAALCAVCISCGKAEKTREAPTVTSHKIWTNDKAVNNSVLDSALLAPDITYPDLNGGEFRLSDHRGTVIVLNLWATWCGPCIREIPDFVALQEEFGDRNLEFVGISVDERGAGVVRPFVEEHGINYRILLDTEGSVLNNYPIQGLPETYIINEQGEIAHVIHSVTSQELLRPLLEHLVES